MNKQNRNLPIDTEKKLMVAKGEEVGVLVKLKLQLGVKCRK